MSRSDFWTSRLPVLFSLLILLVFVVAVVQIWNFPLRAKQFPLTIGIPMLVLALIQVGLDIFKPRKHAGPAPSMATGMGMGAMPAELQQATSGQGQDDRARLEELRHELEELEDLEDAETIPHTKRDVVIALVWFFSFFVVLWLLGFMITVPLYTIIYLLVVAREKWWFAGVGGVLAWLFLWAIFEQVGHLPFFPGQVLTWLGLD